MIIGYRSNNVENQFPKCGQKLLHVVSCWSLVVEQDYVGMEATQAGKSKPRFIYFTDSAVSQFLTKGNKQRTQMSNRHSHLATTASRGHYNVFLLGSLGSIFRLHKSKLPGEK